MKLHYRNVYKKGKKLHYGKCHKRTVADTFTPRMLALMNGAKFFGVEAFTKPNLVHVFFWPKAYYE